MNTFLLLFDVFTFVVWGWVIVDFLTKARLSVPLFVSTLYLLMLASYVGDKELRRWRKKYHSHARRGEYFVYLWGLTMVAVVAFYVWGGRDLGYGIPQELPTIAGSVLILYIITEYLKKGTKRD